MTWHGVKVGQPDWTTCSHSIALTVEMPDENLVVHLIANAYWEALDFELPPTPGPGVSWGRWINTGLDAPRTSFTWKARHQLLRALYGRNPVR